MQLFFGFTIPSVKKAFRHMTRCCYKVFLQRYGLSKRAAFGMVGIMVRCDDPDFVAACFRHV